MLKDSDKYEDCTDTTPSLTEVVHFDQDFFVEMSFDNGQTVEFKHVFSGIKYKGEYYAVLMPVTKLEGMNEGESLMFKVWVGPDGKDRYELVTDDVVIGDVLEIYNATYGKQNF